MLPYEPCDWRCRYGASQTGLRDPFFSGKPSSRLKNLMAVLRRSRGWGEPRREFISACFFGAPCSFSQCSNLKGDFSCPERWHFVHSSSFLRLWPPIGDMVRWYHPPPAGRGFSGVVPGPASLFQRFTRRKKCPGSGSSLHDMSQTAIRVS